MQSPKDNPPKKPSVMDWKQRRGTSISLGSLGQSALRPSTGARPSLLNPKPQPQAKAAPAQSRPAAIPPTKPAPLPAAKPSADGSPPVSRAFMSGSLVPPRPLNQRPQPQPMPEFPRREAPAARAATQPQPLPKAEPKPAPASESQARPAAPRVHGIAPVVEPKPEPKPEPEVAAAVAAAPAAPAAPRRAAKNVRQFNAAVAADARGAPAARTGLMSRKGLMAGAAVAVVAGISVAGWWFMSHRGPAASSNGIGGSAATEVSLAPTAAPPAASETVADNSSASTSTSAVTEAPSDAADEVSSVIAERPSSGQPTNFGALAPKGVRPAQPAGTRAGRVVLADLPDAPDLGASTGRAEAETAPAPPAPAAPTPTPVIRLPSGDEPFSTNTPNPEPGG